jgi:nickel-dependent lactate racemase
MTDVRYGSNSSVRLECAGGALPEESGTPRGAPLASLTEAMAAGLRLPIDYPPLAQCTTPGDRVVVAVDHGAPQVALAVGAVVAALVEAGVDPDGITVLQTAGDRKAGVGDPCRAMPTVLRNRVARLTHDPEDRRQLAYLAATESGEPILVNRAIHEADVVLPLACLRADEASGYFGIHSAIFPAFSDTKTIQRFRDFGSLNGHGARRRELAAEVDHVAWLLGVNLTIQLVPAAGDGVLDVLVGESEAVRRRAREVYRAAWHWPNSRRADLVIASIEGGAERQTWENFGLALQMAGNFVESDGAIAVCCELAAAPGPAMQHLAGTGSREAALRHVGKQRPVDALPAAQLARALDRGKVYLLSRLDPSAVEELDMIPVGGPDELLRLARQHPSCIVLSNAPYVTTGEGLGIRDWGLEMQSQGS